MCHGQRLEDATDRLPGLRAQEKVEVVGHQAIAEEAEGIALIGVGDGLEKGEVIGIGREDITAIVAPVEGVVDQSVVDGSRLLAA
jgi:hypothetical protein